MWKYLENLLNGTSKNYINCFLCGYLCGSIKIKIDSKSLNIIEQKIFQVQDSILENFIAKEHLYQIFVEIVSYATFLIQNNESKNILEKICERIDVLLSEVACNSNYLVEKWKER